MLKLLMKKELLELVSGIITDRKNGRKAKNGTMIIYAALFVVIFVCFGLMFYEGAFGITKMLVPLKLEWLSVAIMAVATVGIGLFGSVLTAYSTIYLPKDNEFLLSMPIDPGIIITVRIAAVYIMGLIFSACAWIPTLIAQWTVGGPVSAFGKINGIILLFALNLLTTTLACILGWVVAIIASRIPTKRKSIVTVAVSLTFLGVYYYAIGNAEQLVKAVTENAAGLESSIRGWGYIFYQVGLAATGEVMPMLIFVVVTIVAFLICRYLLKKNFVKIATMKKGDKKTEYKSKPVQVQSVDRALMNRELRRFTGLSTYMMNTGLGVFLAPVAAIAIFVKRDSINVALELIRTSGGNSSEIIALVPVIACITVCIIIGMDAIATPSISLEGNTLWILKSMPTETYKKLAAKSMAQFSVNIVPAIISTVIVAVALGIRFKLVLCMLSIVIMFTMFTAELDLMLAFYKVNLEWKNIQVPVKQAVNVLLALLADCIACMVITGMAFVLIKITDVVYTMLVIAVLLYAAAILCRRWNMTRGVALFEAL